MADVPPTYHQLRAARAAERPVRWRLSLGPVYEVGNPNATHFCLPMGVPVVGSEGRANAPLSAYTLVDCDASYDVKTARAGLAYRIGDGPPRSTVRVGLPSSVIAEMTAGLLALMAARASHVPRVCLRTDNQVLAYTFADRWFPRKTTTYRIDETLSSVKRSFEAIAVAHVRTREIAAVDRAARRVRLRASALFGPPAGEEAGARAAPPAGSP